MRAKRAGYNALAYGLAFMLNAAVTLLTSPLLIEGLGVGVFGIWKTLQKVFDIVSVTDGRSGQALKMIIARAEGDAGNDVPKKEAIGAAIFIWLFYLPLALISLGCVYFFLPKILGYKEVEALHGDVTLLFAFLSVNFLIAPLVGIPDAVLMGINQGYKSIVIQIAGTIMSNIAMVVVVVNGFGLVGLGEVSVTTTFLIAFMITVVVKKAVTWFAIKIPNMHAIKTQGNKTFFMMLWMLIEKVLLSSDMVLIGALCGPTFAASYSIMTYVPQMAIALVLIVGASITPGLASMQASGNDGRWKPVVKVFREVVLMLGTLFASMYVLFNKSFILLWVGNDLLLSQSICVLLGLSIFQISHARSEAQLQDTNLAAKSRVLIGGFGAATSIAFSFLFSRAWPDNSLFALLVGGVVGRLLITLAYPFITNRSLGIKEKVVWAPVNSILIFSMISVASFFMPTLPLLWLLAIGIVVFICLIPVCTYLILSNGSRKYLTLRIQPVIMRVLPV